jgi:hypothetical protein
MLVAKNAVPSDECWPDPFIHGSFIASRLNSPKRLVACEGFNRGKKDLTLRCRGWVNRN